MATSAARPRPGDKKESVLDENYQPRKIAVTFQSPITILNFFVAHQSAASKGAGDIGTALRGKKSTLRRLLDGKKETNEAERRALDEQAIIDTIGDEAHAVSKRLMTVADQFVNFLAKITDLRQPHEYLDVLTFAPFVLLDDHVVEHPRLKRKGIQSNADIVLLGRALLQTYVCTETWKHGYTHENTLRRYNDICKQTSVWLTKVCKEMGKDAKGNSVCEVRDILPVTWSLDPNTHEPLDEATLQDRTLKSCAELPFIIIGLFNILDMRAQADTVIRALYQEFV